MFFKYCVSRISEQSVAWLMITSIKLIYTYGVLSVAKTLMSDVFQILCKQDIWSVAWLKITSAEPIYTCGLLSVAENVMLDVCQTV